MESKKHRKHQKNVRDKWEFEKKNVYMYLGSQNGKNNRKWRS